MSNYAELPKILQYGKLALTRQNLGRFQITMEGLVEPIASVEPDEDGSWFWLHYESERVGTAAWLSEVAAVIDGIHTGGR